MHSEYLHCAPTLPSKIQMIISAVVELIELFDKGVFIFGTHRVDIWWNALIGSSGMSRTC